jgi:hypothetical protein
MSWGFVLVRVSKFISKSFLGVLGFGLVFVKSCECLCL